MKGIRTIAAASLALITMGLEVSCSYLNESQLQLLTVSDQYAMCLAMCDLSGICDHSENSNIGEDNSWSDRLSFTQGRYYEGDNAANAALKVAEGITYELQSDSIKISDNSGSIMCTFSVPDYASAVADTSINNIDSFYDRLYSNDCIRYECRLEFHRVEGDWLAVNTEDIMNELYSFTEVDYSYDTAIIDLVLGKYWYGSDYSDRGEYYNTDCIDMDILLAEGADYSSIYYTVEYDGREVHRKYGTFEGYLYAHWDNAPSVYQDGCLVLREGEYTVTFYDRDGTVLVSGVAYVYVG